MCGDLCDALMMWERDVDAVCRLYSFLHLLLLPGQQPCLSSIKSQLWYHFPIGHSMDDLDLSKGCHLQDGVFVCFLP